MPAKIASYPPEELTLSTVELLGVSHLFSKECHCMTDSSHISAGLTTELFKHVVTETI